MWSEALQRATAPVTHSAAVTTQDAGFLRIEGLSKTYTPGKPVFDGVHFTMDKGEFVCVIGHSGCGKTTILNVLAGLDTPSSGHVIMDGREVSGPSLDRGVVFQGHALMPWLMVQQNSVYPSVQRPPAQSVMCV